MRTLFHLSSFTCIIHLFNVCMHVLSTSLGLKLLHQCFELCVLKWLQQPSLPPDCESRWTARVALLTLTKNVAAMILGELLVSPCDTTGSQVQVQHNWHCVVITGDLRCTNWAQTTQHSSFWCNLDQPHICDIVFRFMASHGHRVHPHFLHFD